MFGGRCYYIDEKPFSFVLGDALALRLSQEQLTQACGQADGQVFHPGGGDFIMREYLELSDQALADEEKIDTYVQASTRFMGGQQEPEQGLVWDDLRQGRDGLYKQKRET
jgi:TfoX/Sxy family transcriptional regulator of competence genes